MSTPNLALISQHLNCTISQIINIEEWQHIYFVKVEGRRPTFLSKKKFNIVEEKPITHIHASDFLNQFLSITFNISCLCNGSYSKDTNTLSLRFHSGSTYDYYNVPLIIWQELTKSYVSPGKAYNQLIKGRYRGCKVA
ncbi:MAG: KTSC domain-containing protein [Xenococcaceae cyanobacterium]